MIKIDQIDNGFILQYIKQNALTQRAEPVSIYFPTKEALIQALGGIL
jgi:hypothetical protein